MCKKYSPKHTRKTLILERRSSSCFLFFAKILYDIPLKPTDSCQVTVGCPWMPCTEQLFALVERLEEKRWLKLEVTKLNQWIRKLWNQCKLHGTTNQYQTAIEAILMHLLLQAIADSTTSWTCHIACWLLFDYLWTMKNIWRVLVYEEIICKVDSWILF